MRKNLKLTIIILFIFSFKINAFSSEKSFSDAFLDARENKQNIFQWNSNFYTTKRADETDQQYKKFLDTVINNKIEKKVEALTKENLLEEAIKLFNDKKFKDAHFLFERNMVFNPKDANSYLYLAKIYKQEENQRKEEYNLETTLLIEPDNEEALLMLMKIALEKSNYQKVKDLSEKFVKVCKNLCDENKDIQESLKNIEPENNES